jgi:hypothetical protein
MRSREQSTPPPWKESDSFREPCFSSWTTWPIARPSATPEGCSTPWQSRRRATLATSPRPRAELRAVVADLRYTGGYLLDVIRRSAELCSLDAADERLARFAGKIGRQVDALVEKIERRLA